MGIISPSDFVSKYGEIYSENILSHKFVSNGLYRPSFYESVAYSGVTYEYVFCLDKKEIELGDLVILVDLRNYLYNLKHGIVHTKKKEFKPLKRRWWHKKHKVFKDALSNKYRKDALERLNDFLHRLDLGDFKFVVSSDYRKTGVYLVWNNFNCSSLWATEDNKDVYEVDLKSKLILANTKVDALKIISSVQFHED